MIIMCFTGSWQICSAGSKYTHLPPPPPCLWPVFVCDQCHLVPWEPPELLLIGRWPWFCFYAFLPGHSSPLEIPWIACQLLGQDLRLFLAPSWKQKCFWTSAHAWVGTKVVGGVEAEHDFQLSIKKEYLLEINWDFQCIIMVHSGQILGVV